MAKAPMDWLDDDEPHKGAMRELERERRDQFNRLIGCAVIFIFVAAAVALIIGYWATH